MIGCEDRLRNDLYCVEWGVKLYSTPTNQSSDPLPVKQSVWGKPGILSSRTTVESAISDSCQKARFLAAVASQSGDWLLALPVTSSGLQLTDEAVRVTVTGLAPRLQRLCRQYL